MRTRPTKDLPWRVLEDVEKDLQEGGQKKRTGGVCLPWKALVPARPQIAAAAAAAAAAPRLLRVFHSFGKTFRVAGNGWGTYDRLGTHVRPKFVGGGDLVARALSLSLSLSRTGVAAPVGKGFAA